MIVNRLSDSIPHKIHGAGMLTWLGYIDGIHGAPYIAYMDPMGTYDVKQKYDSIWCKNKTCLIMSNHEKTQKLETIKKQPWDLQIKRNIKKPNNLDIIKNQKKLDTPPSLRWLGSSFRNAHLVWKQCARRGPWAQLSGSERRACVPGVFVESFVVKHDETWWFLAINMMNNSRI